MGSRRTTQRHALAALAAVCLVVQQLLVPIHLAWNPHVFVGAPRAERTALADGAHGEAAHPRHDVFLGEETGHEPHPADDHYDEHVAPADLLIVESVALAPPPTASGAVDVVLEPSLGSPARTPLSPRPPPPLGAAPPRAPPVAS